MQNALASLEARLAKSGGSADDWELLAKSYEFIGRPEAAARARRHELPNGDNTGGGAAVGVGEAVGAGAPVNGEVSLSKSLLAKAPAGSTLFIVAKSVDSPGVPVAALRSSVGDWPVKFTLDDSNSMMPGRNLSSAGRVTIEARISRSGQALPASGDLRGSSGVINSSQRAPLKIVIDEVVR
jgi:cytochrome c-type biogenesis protein CcmH